MSRINLYFIFFLILVQGVPDRLSAQQISLGPFFERNIKSPQLGIAASFRTKKHFGIGLYHQMEISKSFEINKPYREITGLILDLPLVIETRLNLIGRLKPSIAEQRFFIIIPAIETQYTILEFLQIAGEVSYRAGYPAFAIKTNLILNLKN